LACINKGITNAEVESQCKFTGIHNNMVATLHAL